MSSPRWCALLPTAVGPVLAEADAQGRLLRLRFAEGPAPLPLDPGPFRALEAWLEAWSARAPIPRGFELAPAGSDFARRVWAALEALPFGATTTYGQLSRALGGPQLTRAVGRANGSNPIAIVVPCHRVIGQDGALVGYAGGLDRKRRLLDHERGVQGLLFPGGGPTPARG